VPSLVAATPCANLDDSNPFSSVALSSRHFSEGLRSIVPPVAEKIDSFIQPHPDDANAFVTQVFSTHRSRTGRHKHREPLEPRIPNRYQSESPSANTRIPNLAAARQAIRARSHEWRFALQAMCSVPKVPTKSTPCAGPLVSAASARTAVTGVEAPLGGEVARPS
jgi:hypothetical protein